MLFGLIPQEEAFFEQFKKAAHNMIEGSRLLKVMMEDFRSPIEQARAIKDVEQIMSTADFYSDHEKSKPVLAQHQALMWEVGELLGQWEMLQSEAEQYADLRNS